MTTTNEFTGPALPFTKRLAICLRNAGLNDEQIEAEFARTAADMNEIAAMKLAGEYDGD